MIYLIHNKEKKGIKKWTGFTWWINIGVFKGYVPNETIFPTFEDAINDAIEEYPYEYIGIDKVKEDDGWVTTISTVKNVIKLFG